MFNSSFTFALHLRVSLTLYSLLLIVLGLAALAIGDLASSPMEVAGALIAPDTDDALLRHIVLELRLPRILAAVLIGGGLALAGTVMQTVFRNPLAAPDILGVSTGAGLGAAIALLLRAPDWALQLAALTGGITAVVLVMWIARHTRRHDPTLVLVLAGVVVATLAGAGVSAIKALGDTGGTLPALTFWLMGSLDAVEWPSLLFMIAMILIGSVAIFSIGRKLNLLMLSDDEALSLGVHPQRMRVISIGAATLIAASTVAVAGVIGWVGLMIPHLARLVVGGELRRLLPTATLFGAIFLLLVDSTARLTPAANLPIGVWTAVLGGPFFLWLLIRGRS